MFDTLVEGGHNLVGNTQNMFSNDVQQGSIYVFGWSLNDCFYLCNTLVVEGTENWVGKTFSPNLYSKAIQNLAMYILFMNWKKNYIYDVLPILGTDGHMTNCT